MTRNPVIAMALPENPPHKIKLPMFSRQDAENTSENLGELCAFA
jgi:hypothetical protein